MGKEYKKYVPKETVVDVPEGFKEWVKEHTEAQEKWSSTPYFIRDNFKDGKLSKGLNFETGKEIDPIQRQLDQLKPQISSIRTLCNEWGLNTFILDDAIQKRNPSGVVNAISILRSRVDTAMQEYKNFIADATESVKEARKYNVDVSDMLSLISDITSDKREWVMSKASCKKALVDFKEKIWKAIDDAKNNNSVTGKYDNTRADNEDEIENALGIKKAAAMNHQDANELKGNPNYSSGGGYRINCQSCVVAYEMRRRGYDVEANENTRRKGSIPYELSYQTEKAWLDDKSNIPHKQRAGGRYIDGYKIKNKTFKVMMSEFDKLTSTPGRYHIDFAWKNSRSGHIITMERFKDGTMQVYDPQSGKVITDFKTYAKQFKLSHGISVLRVDNLRGNPHYVSGATRRK